MKITMQNKFKEMVTYNIEYKEIISSENYGKCIKVGTPLYVFYMNRTDKKDKQEMVNVMKEYVNEIGIENYIDNSVNNWSINYENDLEKIICQINGFMLHKNDDFYFVITPEGETMVNLGGTKEELINELQRWKDEVDGNNPFMLAVENVFISKLKEKLIGECKMNRTLTVK